jgi:hypothetical protein
MNAEELIERSPMRAVSASIRGGLDAGQLGGVFARAGVGKSAFLIHVALTHALRGTPVLHVSLTDGHARVRSMYDEILTEVANSAHVPDRARFQVEVERNRQIHSCLDGMFAPTQLGALLETVREVLHFRPTVVLVDGIDAADFSASDWRDVAQDSGVRLWFAVRTHRDGGPQANDLADAFDTAVVLTPTGADVSLHVLRAGSQPFAQPEALHLDPVTMMVRPEDVREPATTPPSPPARLCTLFSGGATGAEASFGEHAEKHGVREVNFTFEGHNQVRTEGAVVLDDRELAAGDVSLIYVAHRLHRHWDKTETLRRVLQTQWHVVSHASQVFVVGTIRPDGTVHGGTGWSVELARRWNKRVWVFDQEHSGWFTWSGSAWTAGVPVIESPDFAGTGTRFLNDAGRAAITALFARSFGTP